MIICSLSLSHTHTHTHTHNIQQTSCVWRQATMRVCVLVCMQAIWVHGLYEVPLTERKDSLPGAPVALAVERTTWEGLELLVTSWSWLSTEERRLTASWNEPLLLKLLTTPICRREREGHHTDRRMSFMKWTGWGFIQSRGVWEERLAGKQHFIICQCARQATRVFLQLGALYWFIFIKSNNFYFLVANLYETLKLLEILLCIDCIVPPFKLSIIKYKKNIELKYYYIFKTIYFKTKWNNQIIVIF